MKRRILISIILEIIAVAIPTLSQVTSSNAVAFAKGTGTMVPDQKNIVKKIISNVYVLIYDPIMECRNNKRLHEVFGWNDPRELVRQYVKDINDASWGIVEHRIVIEEVADRHPVKLDRFSYTDESYIEAWEKHKFHHPDSINYYTLIEKHNIIDKVESGEIDEVWFFCYPYAGCYESQMVGYNAYWCNSPPIRRNSCNKSFIIMGFNYERGVGCMLENLGHRTESIVSHIYGSWNSGKGRIKHLWDKFTSIEKNNPGQAACGNIHYAPNAEHDYEWGNTKYVYSSCDDWLKNFPDLTGEKKLVNCSEWGEGDQRRYMIWWFKHIPHKPGINRDGKLNNWWHYIYEYYKY